jgi:hypothetical protein
MILAARDQVPKTLCRLGLSNGLVLEPRKGKSRFGCFGTSQGAFENPTFLPVVHRIFTASIWSKFIFPGLYSFNLPGSFPFEIFVKSFFNQILVEQGKVKLLLKKPCHFSEKNYSKIRNTL